ncbi:probable UDP-3-O-acylglucosamine N-acyltransferase 2, mitochondrial isoform X2 [Phalaenopsis equestris]|uniref:probable UDP-3-O-acylglucosamine N-acyltransferase 2, mitochondrial isoform X2 n=1 Tax=Phalaenopsis equestris TaxID=78828 RepID=UPI0009E416F8|nr:probable UDP-3-O-acylglucosamine N-acyltransferase 2, mitochondrial isoform X2 [Phalaenopsis equestris]
MLASGRGAFSALHFLSKRAFSQGQVEAFCASKSILHSKPVGCEETIRDSLGFAEWHNGGGLFHRSAHVDPSVFIEIGAIVHQKAIIGAEVHIGSGSIVGPSVSIGQSTNIRYNTVLSNCSVGMSCVIHNGSSIGQDGFGYFVDEEGNMMKKPQSLYVRIGDHVEIGANSCIDRGSWRDTVIGDYTKIDNLVQIGHNAVIGKCCILCGQVGIAGSVTIGDYCTLAGRVAVKDHVTISSKVRLAANSCVTKDVGEPGDYAGFPAVPIHQWRRQSATLRRLSKKDPKKLDVDQRIANRIYTGRCT